MEVDHKNRIKDQNGISNLQSLTPQQHIDRNKQTGVYRNSSNEPQISEDDPRVPRIKELKAAGVSYREIENQTGILYVTCFKIVKGTYNFKESKPEPDCVDPEDDSAFQVCVQEVRQQMSIAVDPDNIRYYDVQKLWTKKIVPHLDDKELNNILVRDFNRYTFGTWRERFVHGQFPCEFRIVTGVGVIMVPVRGQDICCEIGES